MDENFLKGLQNGDEKVISFIYKNFYPKIRYFVIKNEGSSQEAEETFHNALFQLTIRLKTSTIVIKSSFEAYLFTVCKNLWRKELNAKKKWVRKEHEITHRTEDKVDHGELIIAQERWELFEEKMELLSPNCKELLKAYFAKIPYHEIVKRFQYSSENVAFQRVFKCKKRLTDLVKRDTNYQKLKY
jgi:RNA polymerase sigma factor (sigma-70 family)